MGSDNPRKDPLVGEAHQIDPASLPPVISQAEYLKQLDLQGEGPNCDSKLWGVVWVAIDDNDPRTKQADDSELFAVYPGMEESAVGKGPSEWSYANGSSTPSRNKS